MAEARDERGSGGIAGRRYRLVIFDMDGTLTHELLDFDAIRREIGMPFGGGILEFMAGLPEEKRLTAAAILHGHEILAARQSTLHDGVAEMLLEKELRGAGDSGGSCLTRKSAACTAAVLERHGLQFEWVATREQLPHKPHGDSILNIARRLGILPEQTLMVGDYLYDMQAAQNAGAAGVLLWSGEGPEARPAYAAMARYVIGRLMDVLAIVDGDFQE